MRKTETSTEMQQSKERLECSAAWGGANPANPTVAFRVTDEDEDTNAGRNPAWEPWPLTEEEETMLRGSKDVY